MYFSLCGSLTSNGNVSGQTCSGDLYATLQANSGTCTDYSTDNYTDSVTEVTYADNADNFAVQYMNGDDIFTVGMVCTDDATTVIGALASVVDANNVAVAN
jgi:hypothetical protein